MTSLRTRPPRTSSQRKAKDKKPEMEGLRANEAALMGEVLLKINEVHHRYRQEALEANRESLKELSSKFEALQLSQLEQLEAHHTTIRMPIPKYSGKPGEFEDWKESVQNCIKCNDWTDEKRILEMLPAALTGQAQRMYATLSHSQKSSLDTLFSSLRESLDQACKAYNRELFIKAKRLPGESMKNFVNRCSLYIVRADDIKNINESQWAIPFLVEKIYTNLNSWDRKILKSGAGKSEDIHELSERADKLLGMGEEVVGSTHTETYNRGWHNQPPYVENHHMEETWENDHGRNHSAPRPPRSSHKTQEKAEATKNTHKPRPGGGASRPPEPPEQDDEQKGNECSLGEVEQSNHLNCEFKGTLVN